MSIDFNKYKCFKDGKWYYGDLERAFNLSNELIETKSLFMKSESSDVYQRLNLDDDIYLCRCAYIKDSNDKYIYENDIIDFIDSEGNAYQFIIKIGKTEINFNCESPIYLDGLYLQDFNGKSLLFSVNLVDNSKYITVVGNTIENNIKDI